MIVLPEDERVHFKYRGRNYVAYGKFDSGGFEENIHKIYGSGAETTPSKYTFKSFYTVAKNCGVGDVNIFVNNGKLVIPGKERIYEMNPKYAIYEKLEARVQPKGAYIQGINCPHCNSNKIRKDPLHRRTLRYCENCGCKFIRKIVFEIIEQPTKTYKSG